jgi:hypothetical protein
MSLDRMLGSVRCNSGRQRALSSFERFVGLGVRMPTRDETCVSPTELCKFPLRLMVNSRGVGDDKNQH